MNISSEAVEAAAKAIAGKHWQTAMDDARAALEAAAPFFEPPLEWGVVYGRLNPDTIKAGHTVLIADVNSDPFATKEAAQEFADQWRKHDPSATLLLASRKAIKPQPWKVEQ